MPLSRNPSMPSAAYSTRVSRSRTSTAGAAVTGPGFVQSLHKGILVP